MSSRMDFCYVKRLQLVLRKVRVINYLISIIFSIKYFSIHTISFKDHIWKPESKFPIPFVDKMNMVIMYMLEISEASNTSMKDAILRISCFLSTISLTPSFQTFIHSIVCGQFLYFDESSKSEIDFNKQLTIKA